MPHRPALLSFSLLLLSLTTTPLRAQETQLLSDLVGWSIAGLEAVDVSGVVTGDGYFTGNVPDLEFNGASVSPLIAGFSVPGSDNWAVVVSFDRFSLPDYLPALSGTGLEDLAFSDLRLIFAPPGAARSAFSPPSHLAPITGASVDLPTKASIGGMVSLLGSPAELLRAIGVDGSSLPVAGSIPVGLFTKEIDPSQIASALYPLLDLTIAVPQSVLDAATPPIPGASLDSLTFHVDGLSGEPAFALTGGISLGDLFLQVTASGGAGEDGISIEVTGDATLGQLVGADVPGLNDIHVTGLQITEGSLSGDLNFRGVDFQVMFFESPGHMIPNVAFIAPELKFSTLVPGLAGTPLDDLYLKPAGLILVPPGNLEAIISLPGPIADFTGQDVMTLKPGFNMASRAAASGVVGGLLDLLHVPLTGLPLGGAFDPSVFSDAIFGNADPAAIFRQIEIDLTVPLPSISIPGVPDFLTTSGDTLRLTNGPDGFSVTVDSNSRIQFPGGDPLDFSTSISLGEQGDHKFVAISGTSHHTWRKPFGIEWIELDSLTLSASFGTVEKFSIGATTDLGSVKGLDVTTSLTLRGGGIQEALLSLMGSDIPLNAIPMLAQFPSAEEFILRDITVSNTAISGQARMRGHPAVDAVLFKSQEPQPGWNLAMMVSDLSIRDIIPTLPDLEPLDAILDEVKLDDLVLVLSEYGVTDDMADLPHAAQATLTKIYGPSGVPDLPEGLGLLGGFDPANLSSAAQQALSSMGVGGQKLALGGSIGGVFSGEAPSFELQANLPAVSLPKEILFLGLPESMQGAFYFKFLSPTELGFGVKLKSISEMPTDNDPLKIESDIFLEINPTGGVEVGVVGITQSPWRDAFGIQGFDMLEGCELGISISASSEVHMEATGHARVGSKEMMVTGSFGITLEGIPTRGSFSGQLDTLSMGDVMALTNAVATVGGGAPVKTDFPDAKLTDMVIAFASPLETISVDRIDSDKKLTVTGPGIALGGKLWMFYPDSPLGEFNGQIDATGLVATGDVHDFTLGGFSMKGNYLDVSTKLDPLDPPHFRVLGNATIEGTETTITMDAEVTRFTFSTDQTFAGANFSYDLGLFYQGPTSLTPQGLAQLDLGVDAGLSLSQIQDFITGPGADAAQGALDGVTSMTDSLDAQLELARTAVATLTDSVAKYRAVAKRDKQTREQGLADGRQAVQDAQSLLDSYDPRIKSAKRHIKAHCSQRKRVCVTILGQRVCHRVPDVSARLTCGSNNTKYGLQVLNLEGQRDLAEGGLSSAQDALILLQDGNQAIPIDSDPRVLPWLGLLKAGQATLQSAQDEVDAVQNAAASAQQALDVFQSAAQEVKVTRGRIRGSFRQMLTGGPLILDVDYEVSGQPLTTRVPFNSGDLAYSTRYLELLALQGAYAAIENDPDAPEAVKDVFRQRYLAKQKETDTELDIINQINNVPPDSGSQAGGGSQPDVDSQPKTSS